MGLYNESLNQNIDNLQVNGKIGNGGGTGGSGFKSEILYKNSGTSREEILLSKPYNDFDYLDITIIKYDDNSHYDFMHTIIDCSQQSDILNNTLYGGRNNNNFIDVWATASYYMQFKFTDATHITYPGASGSCAIYEIKGIKF